MLKIRKIQEQDAEDFLALCKKLDEETQFMMLELGERITTTGEQRERIKVMLAKDNHTIFVAEDSDRLAGFLAASGGNYQRNKRSVYIVVGILQSHIGRGIGARLFAELENWAREFGIHRLELTVMIHNTRGVNLYRKMGFEIEGIKKDSLFINGKYVDEYYMSKLL